MKEEFRWVIGYEGAYKISNFGRVLSVARIDSGGYRRQERFLTAKIGPYGYLRVFLSKNGKTYTKKVHRLIAEAFIPNPENKPEVDHIDGNKTNNSISNLRWATSRENMNNPVTHARMSDSGKINANYGERSPFARKIGQYLPSGELVQVFDSAGRAAAATGLGYSAIRKCANGKMPTCGGFVWKHLTNATIKPRWGRKMGMGGKPIIQKTLDGIVVAEYESIGCAAAKTGFHQANIGRAAKSNNKPYNGYLWSFKEQE